MITASDVHGKMISALQLLQGAQMSIATFERVRTLAKGFSPEVDKKLELCSYALSKVQKLQAGDVISLTAEALPEDTEENKKRKKALLLFISSLRNLKNEIKRVDSELIHPIQVTSWGRIIGFSKGPFGLITIAALIIVGVLFIFRGKSPKKLTAPTIQVITYQGKLIPLHELYVGHGSDCDSPHYHATTGTVTALDGTVIPDPENCGYGKLSNVHTREVPVSPTP